MVKSPLSIGIVQMDIHWEQPERNRMKLDELFESLTPSDIIFLPEMFASGFTMNVSSMAEKMDGQTISWLLSTSSKLKIDLVGSVMIEEHDQYFNRLIWVKPDGKISYYDKRHLFALAGEERVFTAGSDRVIINSLGWNFRPMICYDLRFPVWSRSNIETDVIVYVANFPDKRRHAWRQLLIARAIENQCFVVGVNRIGWDGQQHFYSGDSCVISPQGKMILDLGSEETFQSCTIEMVDLQKLRNSLPFLADADQFEIKRTPQTVEKLDK